MGTSSSTQSRGTENQIAIKELDRKRLPEWYNFLAQAFSGVPRNYFVRHYECDPYNEKKIIKAALVDGNIVGSVCIFPRTSSLSIKGKTFPVAFGGLGEATTNEKFRGQGLMKTLLQEALAEAKEKGMNLSLVFTNTTSAPAYKALGYKAKRREFIRESIQNFSLKDTSKRVMQPTIRKPVFSNEKEIDTLTTLYRNYAKRFSGMLVRDHKGYWKNWIAAQALGDLSHSHSVTLVMCSPDNSDMIEAYLTAALKKHGATVILQIQDFFVSEEMYSQDAGRSGFELLVRAAIHELRSPSIGCKWPTEVDANQPEKIHRQRQDLAQQIKAVVYPAPLFPSACLPPQGCDWMTDESLMYKIIDSSDVRGDIAYSNIVEGLKPENFVYWEVDSF